jgi:archaellum component FlaC
MGENSCSLWTDSESSCHWSYGELGRKVLSSVPWIHPEGSSVNSWMPFSLITTLFITEFLILFWYYRRQIKRLRRERTEQLVSMYKSQASKTEKLSSSEKKLKDEMRMTHEQLQKEKKQVQELSRLQSEATGAIQHEAELRTCIGQLEAKCHELEAQVEKFQSQCAYLEAKLSQATSAQWELSAQIQQEEGARIAALERLRAPSTVSLMSWINDCNIRRVSGSQ